MRAPQSILVRLPQVNLHCLRVAAAATLGAARQQRCIALQVGAPDLHPGQHPTHMVGIAPGLVVVCRAAWAAACHPR